MTSKRTIVVTGAASGIGAATAAALARAGYHVCLTDVQSCEHAAQAIREFGGSSSSHYLDVAREESWTAIVAYLVGQSPLGGLVNNAGINQREGVMDTDPAVWQRVLDVNLTGPFLGMRALAPLLREAGGGSIVNVSSAGALTGHGAAAYGASKWGLRGLTKTAAGEFAPWGIRVNSVHPGLIETPLVRKTGPYRESHVRSIPIGRLGSVDEVAGVVTFLISDTAAYMTGAEISIDGGLIADGIYGRILRDSLTDPSVAAKP